MKKLLFSLFLISCTLISCTDSFQKINTDEYKVNQAYLRQDFNSVRTLFQPMLQGAVPYDLITTLRMVVTSTGPFSGYIMTPTPFLGDKFDATYKMIDYYDDHGWTTAYQNVMANALKVKRRAKKDFPAFYYWSLIIKVEAMQRITNLYGPLVYSKYGTNDNVIPYDSQKEVYNQFFDELDKVVAGLYKIVKDGDPQIFGQTDISSYQGSYVEWIKFANSLRLRLAMQIVNIDPIKAEKEAEKAVNHPVGVMTSNADNLFILSPQLTNPFNTIVNSWGDCRINASIVSYLRGYNDPRLKHYAKKSKDYPNKYIGIRSGIPIKVKTTYVGFSKLSDEITHTNRRTWMVVAEVYFLRAEGALRGWDMGGTAKEFYEKGITTSLKQYGEGSHAKKYLSDDTSTQAPYIDPKNPEFSSKPSELSTITIKWNPNASKERKLERIITQKWIAMFPLSQQAWADYRRTGYPVLFKNKVNYSNGKISTEYGVRRFPFPASEREGNPKGVEGAVKLLKGSDTGGTRLWWDVKGPNF